MKIDFLGIPVDNLTMSETLNLIDDGIRQNKRINHVVINAGKVVSMQTDKELFESVVSCDIINADGQSVVWAARFLGKHIPEMAVTHQSGELQLAIEKKILTSCH